MHFLWGVFSIRDQLRAVPEFLIDNISLEDPTSSAREMSQRVFGSEAADKLLEPLLRPIAGVTTDMMSSLYVPYSVSDWTQLITLRGGLERLPLALSKRLNVRFQTTVHHVHSNADDVTVDYVDATGTSGVLSADKCLITTLYDDAEAMYPRLAQISDFGRKMQFLRMLDVKLAYSKAPASRAAMVMMSFKENPKINVIMLSHNKASDRAPAGHALFSAFTEHLHYDNYAAMSDDEAVAVVRREIEALYPEIKGHFLFSHVGRQPRICYVPDISYFHRARQLWDAVGREPRVHLGGSIFVSGGMESAVISGEHAAERLVSTLPTASGGQHEKLQ